MRLALSLTQRLALFFTLVASVVVLGLGWLFMVAADQHFLDIDRQVIDDKQHLIEDILASANSGEDIRWRLGEALQHHHGLYVVVTTPQGELLHAPEGFQVPPQAQWQPVPFDDGVSLAAWSHGGADYLALHTQMRPAHAPTQPLQVLIALDTGHHRHFLDALRAQVALYAVLATLVSGLLGWAAAHRGMAPLRAMKARAAGVNGRRMDARMPVDTVPVEMADLALELNHMLDRLQDDLRRLSEFSSDLAHELRTPISNLLTQTQVTLSHPRCSDDYRHALASNAEELERLARTVSDMLFLAKADHGLALPSLGPIDLAREALDLFDFYDALAADRQLELRLEGSASIQGDRLMVRRALSNLLSNAIRHAQAGTPVVLRLACNGPNTEVSVVNQGDAIAPDVLPRLFDRFFRADKARSHPHSDGAGLGLAITRAIVQAHGGSVGAESSGGHNRFWLRFVQGQAAPT